jgi:nitroreductase
MDVYEAITSRRSVRKFLSQPVPEHSLRRVLEGAARAPSGHNIQPWRVFVLTGAAKERLSAAILGAIDTEPAEANQPEFDYYPTTWFEPYLARRRRLGHSLYTQLGIARDDKAARERQMRENYRFFGAPVGMIITFDRRLATGTYMDIGMFLQSIFVGARGEGLDTCGQACFNWYHKVIRRELALDDDQLVACGLSLGFADPQAAENRLAVEKLAVDDFATFLND